MTARSSHLRPRGRETTLAEYLAAARRLGLPLPRVSDATLDRAALKWGLNDLERAVVRAYLDGPRRCEDYDSLPNDGSAVIQQVIRELEGF